MLRVKQDHWPPSGPSALSQLEPAQDLLSDAFIQMVGACGEKS